jgi:hypothetical protein
MLMKKTNYVLMVIMLAAGLTACSSSDDEDKGQEQNNEQQDIFVPIDLSNANTVLNFDPKSVLARVKVNICHLSMSNFIIGIEPYSNYYDVNRIYIRSLACSGFLLKGALQTSSIASGQPVWKDYDGQSELLFSPMTFHDGRVDWKEGSATGTQSDEPNQYFNPDVIENYVAVNGGKFGAEKNPGVTEDAAPLFNVSSLASTGDGYFYVIPRNQGKNVDLEIVYYVETIDSRIPYLLTDDVTYGSVIENKKVKAALLGQDVDFKPGKSYVINITLSGEINVEISDWR